MFFMSLIIHHKMMMIIDQGRSALLELESI